MRFTMIPTTSLQISTIGLGCATFGREIDETASFTLMDHAHAQGVMLFDTAAAYGEGASERIVGAWLASRRAWEEKITVATKIYPPFEPANITMAVGHSLERLGMTTVDLLYLHKWDETAATPAALITLDRLLGEGRVRALGVSNFSAAQLARVLELQAELGFAPFRVLQNCNNLALRDVDEPVRQLCTAHRIAIVTYSPLGAGFLTSKHRHGVPHGSRFDLIPSHQRIYFQKTAYDRLTRLETVARRTGYSQVQLALAWALHQRGVASVLVGGRTPMHLDQAFAALAIHEPSIFAELEAD